MSPTVTLIAHALLIFIGRQKENENMGKQKYDFDKTWDTLVAMVQKSGVAEAIEHIQLESDPHKRNAWLGFFSQSLLSTPLFRTESTNLIFQTEISIS